MYNVNFKPLFLTHRGNNLTVISFVARSLRVLFVAGLSAVTIAGAEGPRAPIPSARFGVPFAIADFDGDSRPDLASISAGQSDFSHTEYWIQLQLSAAGRQSIRLVAPAGGLRIAARDVNGDTWLDLIISAAWTNQPVAIYLNDGHGSFTHVEPATFLEAFGKAKLNWTSFLQQMADAVGTPPQSRPGICPESRGLSHLQLHTGLVAISNAQAFFDSFLLTLRDRAPPH